MDLLSIESTLADHFRRLKAAKTTGGQSSPVFAIEHCLAEAQVADLGRLLGASLNAIGSMSEKHRLAWVVHASERGYAFAGLEYWDSFADITPHWKTRGDRATLRAYFIEFSRLYAGISPTGPWASHYRNIAWPISHAILPRDLQVQLAQTIYRARHQIHYAWNESDEHLGSVVATFASYPTHRFTLFLQNKAQVGLIVRALLKGEGEGGAAGIEARALQRIVDALRSESRSRDWLNESRRVYEHFVVRSRAVSNASSGLRALNPLLAIAGDVVRPKREPSLEPRLRLSYQGGDEWKAILQVPSFAHLAEGNDGVLEQLESATIQVPCCGEQRFPASTLLSPAGWSRPIKKWPAEQVALLKFDRAMSPLDELVALSVQLRSGSLWIFRISAEGSAQHVTGANVRPGERYVVVARERSRLQGLGSPLRLSCEGAAAALLQVDEPVGPALAQRLRQAGLATAYTVTIEPIGVLPERWSSQHLGEWLSTETPCLRLVRDHDFSHYSVEVDGGAPTRLPCVSTSDQLIALEGLSVGEHQVKIATHAGAIAGPRPVPDIRSVGLPILIRPPRTWSPGRLPLNTMLVRCAPASPTLADFIAGRVELSVDGELSRQVAVTLMLLDSLGVTVQTLHIAHQHLPLRLTDWHAAVGHALEHGGEELDLLAIESGHLLIDGGDLGQRRIALRHCVQPLRWLYTLPSRGQAQLRLADDREESKVVVRRYAFAQPTLPKPIGVDRAMLGLQLGQEDGLFVASNVELEASVIVSPIRSGKGLDWLRVSIRNQDLPTTLAQTLETFRLWANARVCGLLSRHRQRQVLTTLQEHALAQVTGHPWLKLEVRLPAAPSEEDWERLEAAVAVQFSSSYGIALSKLWPAPDTRVEDLEDKFTELTCKSHMASDEAVARRAWKFAAGLRGLSVEDAHAMSGPGLGRYAAAVRGARLIRLYAEKNRGAVVEDVPCRA